MKKTIKYSILGLAALCTVVLLSLIHIFVVQQLPTIYPKPLQKKYPMELFKYPNVSLHLQNVSLKERIEL